MENEAHIVRTIGFARAHDEENILGCADLGIDAVGPDLEDLTPKHLKQQARDIFRDVAKQLAARGVTVMARINTLENGAEADLDAIVCPELHCVNISKAESAEDVLAICRLLDKVEAANGLPVGHTLVRPVIETAKGVRWAYEIAAASPRVTYMGGVAGGFWGDLGGTLGTISGPDGMESYYIRSKVIVDVRAADVRFPVGGGGTSRRDPDGIREFAWQNKRLGYTGQYTSLGYYGKDREATRELISVINEVYTPTRDEIELWTSVVPGLEQAEREGTIVTEIDGRNYDTAGLERVRDQLALACRLGLTS